MSMTHRCRIGRVRMKAGADVRVIDGAQGGDPYVTALLMDMLKKARRGDLLAVAMVTVDSEGAVGTCWEQGEGPYFHNLASGALTLAFRLGDP